MKKRPYAITGTRNRTLMESYAILDSYRNPISGSDCTIINSLEVGHGFAAHTCYEKKDRKRINALMEQEIEDGKYTKKFFDDIDKKYKNSVRRIKEFSREDLSLSPTEELIDKFNIFYDIYITTLHPMVLAIYASDLEALFKTELCKTLGEKKLSQLEELTLVSTLLTPTRLTTVQKEEQILFDLQDSFERTYKNATEGDFKEFSSIPQISVIFEELSQNYGWFHMEYIGEAKKPNDYKKLLRRRILGLKNENIKWDEQSSPKERLRNTLSKQKEFFESHECSELFKKVVFAMQEYLIVLDFSKADLIEGIFYARPLLKEIGKRVGLNSWIDMRFLLPDEIKSLLRSGKSVDSDFIKERKENFVCLLEDFTITTYFGEEAVSMADKLLEKDEIEDKKQFTGATAYPGKVTGIACLVTSAQDMGKFKTGNILVTRDTTTELTSVIKMSAAIVADHGSMLSHTAIVSREFKIPCLYSTKIGTALVKDGDKLEVDANNGIVKILN